MNKRDSEKLKSDLLERKQKIEAFMAKKEQLGDELAEYNDNNDISGKNDETADEIAEFISNTAINGSLEKTLKDINQALSLIDTGSYGVCKYCGNDIPVERMVVRPVSTSCVSCKSKFTN